jgi:hypothetical protein
LGFRGWGFGVGVSGLGVSLFLAAGVLAATASDVVLRGLARRRRAARLQLMHDLGGEGAGVLVQNGAHARQPHGLVLPVVVALGTPDTPATTMSRSRSRSRCRNGRGHAVVRSGARRRFRVTAPAWSVPGHGHHHRLSLSHGNDAERARARVKVTQGSGSEGGKEGGPASVVAEDGSAEAFAVEAHALGLLARAPFLPVGLAGWDGVEGDEVLGEPQRDLSDLFFVVP